MNEKRLLWSLTLLAAGVVGWLLCDRFALQRKVAKLATDQELAMKMSRDVLDHTDTLAESQNALANALAQARTSNSSPRIVASTATSVSVVDEAPLHDPQELNATPGDDPYKKTLESYFDNQDAHNAWPASNRTSLENALRKLGAAQRAVHDLDCRGAMCRTSISFPGNGEARAFMQQLAQTQNGGWEGAVAANVVNSPHGSATVTFYAMQPGTNLPPSGE